MFVPLLFQCTYKLKIPSQKQLGFFSGAIFKEKPLIIYDSGRSLTVAI